MHRPSRVASVALDCATGKCPHAFRACLRSAPVLFEGGGSRRERPRRHFAFSTLAPVFSAAHLRRASPLLSSTFLSPATPAPVLPCSVPAASPRSLACGAAFQNPSLSQLPGRSVAAARSPPRGPLSASPLPLAPSSPLLVATSTSSSATPPPSGGETYQAPAALCSPENVVRGTHGSGSPLLSGSSASAPSSSPAASFTLTSLSSLASLLSPLLSEPAKLAQARPKGVDRQALWLHLQNQFRATSKAATEWAACLENRTTGTASPFHSVAQGTERAGAMDIQRAAAEPGNSRPGLTAGERAEQRRSGIKETERLEEGMCSPPLATRSGADSEPAKEEERGHGQQEGSAHHLQPVNATGAYDLRREQSRVQVLHGGERSHESPETLGPLPTSGERPFSGETEERNEQLPQQKGWPNVAGRQRECPVEGEIVLQSLCLPASRNGADEPIRSYEPQPGLSVSGASRRDTGQRGWGGESAVVRNVVTDTAAFPRTEAFVRAQPSLIRPPALLPSAGPSCFFRTAMPPSRVAAPGSPPTEGVSWAAGAQPPGAIRPQFRLPCSPPSGLSVEKGRCVFSHEISKPRQALPSFSPAVSPVPPLCEPRPSPVSPFPQNPPFHSAAADFSQLPSPLFQENDVCRRSAGSALSVPPWWGFTGTRGATPHPRDLPPLHLAQTHLFGECFLEQAAPTNPSFPGVQAIGFGPAANLPPAGHATVVGAVSHLVSAGGALEKANKS